MDFLKILKSFEELLYEVITWLLFFPRTLLRILRHPLKMAHYAESELQDKLADQFDENLSPPLFLMLGVLVAHAVELGMHMQVKGTTELARTVLGSEQSLLLYRSIAFAVWPLIAAIHRLRRSGTAITRKTLRKPFFAQCYLTAPFAIAMSTASVFIRLPGDPSTIAGLIVSVIACIWYVCVQAHWLRDELKLGWPNAVLSTMWVLAVGMSINSLASLALVSW